MAGIPYSHCPQAAARGWRLLSHGSSNRGRAQWSACLLPYSTTSSRRSTPTLVVHVAVQSVSEVLHDWLPYVPMYETN
jgi:hypothetical protein